jgi:uncharacterized protein YuzE
MSKLVEAFPVLAREVAQALRALSRAELAQQIDQAEVSRATFDEDADAGCVDVQPSRALNVVETNIVGVRHGETLTVGTEFDVVIDIDNFDRLVGIEILAPGVLGLELKRRASS